MTPAQRGLAGALLLALFVAAASRSAIADPTGGGNCTAAAAGLGAPLERTRQRIGSGSALTVLAIGSSSTLGVGASDPVMSYPSRLERDLAQAFPKLVVRVVNDGRGGQDAEQELARLERDLSALNPDLVIWQVGTNALLRGQDLETERRVIDRGLDLVKQRGADVVLMDLQYAPRVLARSGWALMERLIADAAKRERVGYLRRFEIMREWSLSGRWAEGSLIRADGLHMTDESYGCLAAILGQSLAQVGRPVEKLVRAAHGRPAALAGEATAR